MLFHDVLASSESEVSIGMSIALLINQFVSTVIAAIFLPTVGHHGYASMFFFWAGCTLVYFLVAAFLLTETKGNRWNR